MQSRSLVLCSSGKLNIGSLNGISVELMVGGPAHSFPPFFSGAPLFPFFCSGGNRKHPKTDRQQAKSSKERSFFCQDDNPPPHRRYFPIDLQQRWSINRKIGVRQCTYYLIVRALTVAVLLFFL